MEELFYIKGDPTNPEGVKEALLGKYPEANVMCCLFTFSYRSSLYYVNEDNDIIEAYYSSNLGRMVKMFGTEIFPIKKQEFEERIMYRAVITQYNNRYTQDRLWETVEDMFNYYEEIVGYQEVKVKILKK